METNLLKIHNSITQILINNFGQEAIRVDDEGYEYVDEKYSNIYDILFLKYLKENNIWIPRYM